MKSILENKKLNKKKFIFIKYEDLVLNPQKTLDKVLDLINGKRKILVF